MLTFMNVFHWLQIIIMKIEEKLVEFNVFFFVYKWSPFVTQANSCVFTRGERGYEE